MKNAATDSQNPWLPLWNIPRMAEEISTGVIGRVLDAGARSELAGVTGLEEKVAGALLHPKPLDICLPVFNAVLAAQYYEIFEALAVLGDAKGEGGEEFAGGASGSVGAQGGKGSVQWQMADGKKNSAGWQMADGKNESGLGRGLAVYEPCVGASPPVIFAAEAFSAGQGSYFTINLNRRLRAQLAGRVEHLRMPVRVVEDDARTALEHLAPGSFDVACFHHAINDILQTAVAEPRGMDTTAIDWFPNERQMIEWLAEEARAHGLEERGRPELMRIVGDAVRLVRPGGWLVFDHWNWCKFIGVEWFPWELFYGLVPMARRWIAESGLPVTEVSLEGVDPQWWMFLRVNG